MPGQLGRTVGKLLMTDVKDLPGAARRLIKGKSPTVPTKTPVVKTPSAKYGGSSGGSKKQRKSVTELQSMARDGSNPRYQKKAQEALSKKGIGW